MHDITTNADAKTLAAELIRCPSVTPEDHGALDLMQHWLEALGFRCERLVFADEGLAPIDNLYARLGDAAPNFCFAGHTDVVPAGNEQHWETPPFTPIEKDDALWGRGAADMKGAIGCFLSALVEFLGRGAPAGSISLLITGDEEGMAVNGTRKVLDWLQDKGEKIDHCLVGEPTNPLEMGEMIKVGRRGSYNAHLKVTGVQGHVAYPHRARNPLPQLLHLLCALTDKPLDEGYDRFQPSNLEITSVTTPALAENVIPGEATARFNVRFNPNWTGASLEAHLRERLAAAADAETDWDLTARTSGEAFLTTDDHLIALIARAVEQHTGRAPELSTSGGTSDARFIHKVAPVAEFGLVGASMHKVNEHVALSDIAVLQKIYLQILQEYFGRS